MLIPGLSGHEGRVRRLLSARSTDLGIAHATDRLGNLIATLDGDPGAPSVMLFAHMDQLGFVVRKIEANGLVRVERLGGVPERALPAQAVLFCVGEGRDVPGVIANKSHHATTPEEKYRVLPYPELYIDAGFAQRGEVPRGGHRCRHARRLRPRVLELADGPHRRHVGRRPRRLRGDGRGGARAEGRDEAADGPPRLLGAGGVQPARRAVTAAQALVPDIAIQLDLMLATDTPDMAARGDVRLGGGPAMSLYLVPWPRHAQRHDPASGAGRRCSKRRRAAQKLPLQRSAHIGALTDLVLCAARRRRASPSIDLGFPVRYTHSALESLRPRRPRGLTQLLLGAAQARIDAKFSLDRDDYP